MIFKDKVAIVTGAAAGMGQATALLFAEKVAKAIVFACDPEIGFMTGSNIVCDGGMTN